MSNAPSWQYIKPRLAEALGMWRATGPTAEMQDAVDEALMDLIKDPPEWGIEDPDHPGIYQGTVRTPSGVRIGILYAIPERWVVGVADIRSES